MKRLLFVSTLLICVPLVTGKTHAGDENEGSFWSFLDNLSDEEPTDRYAIQSGFAPRDDYLFVTSEFRARLTRRLNVIGGMRSTIFEDDDEPQLFGFHIGAQEDLIVRANGRIFIDVSFTIYQLTASREWDGGTINEFGIGCGFSQGITFFYRLRYFFQASWNLTGTGEWNRLGGNGTSPLERTVDFKGYHLRGGAVIIL